MLKYAHFINFNNIYFYMSMMKEIEAMMQQVGTSTDYRVVNLGGVSLYVEGIKSVIELSNEQVQFQMKKQILCVAGIDLTVKYLDTTTCVLNGKILRVEAKWR